MPGQVQTPGQVAAKLNHPNTVTIHEVGEYQGRPFFAMEYIESQSHCDIIKEEKPSLDKIIDLTTQVCVELGKAR